MNGRKEEMPYRRMGQFVHPAPPSHRPPSKASRTLSMRMIGERATSLLVELDGFISEVEDYTLGFGGNWALSPKGAIWTRNLEQLQTWRDFILEIGEDSLTWE